MNRVSKIKEKKAHTSYKSRSFKADAGQKGNFYNYYDNKNPFNVAQAKLQEQRTSNILPKESTYKGSMPKNVQNKMEKSFNADFSHVNIYTNSQKAVQLNALAYAQGSNIHFAPGQFNPYTGKGQEILGHELAHVVQQREGRVRSTKQAKGVGINTDKALENEADNFGKKAMRGESIGRYHSKGIEDVSNAFNPTIIQQKGTIQTYRNRGAINFGVDEDSFNKATDKKSKPWVELIYITLSSKTKKDVNGFDMYWGWLEASYYDNAHKLPNISFEVGAGSTLHKTREANNRVHRIEGKGYMSSRYSENYEPNPRNRRYSKDGYGNMDYAIFFKGSQAIHGGPLDESSHGCLHAGRYNNELKQLNYHSVKGLTTVIVRYA